jgi:carboxypeptidase Taq
MSEKYDRLLEMMAEIRDLNHAAALLSWDEQVNMPPGGSEDRGRAMGTIDRLAHEKSTSDELGKLLDGLLQEAQGMDPDSDEARMIRVAKHDFDKDTLVPASFVEELSRMQSESQQAWIEARAKSDFSIFEPKLERVLELGRKYISFFPPADHPYDILLDIFEPGMKTADVQAIFAALRPQQVALVKAISERPQVDDSFLHLPYDEASMDAFSVEIVRAFGYDFGRGRQDRAPHPFCTNFGSNDVRITTRFVPSMPFALLFGSMHETGHALYEQGLPRKWSHAILGRAASLAVHESQSRLWENLVGRSRAFWTRFYPRAQELFPAQLGNVSLDQFYRAINKVQPSFIRVEADEATYNLHIMLRLELEIAMAAGQVATHDLPELWNSKMQEYLGVVPPDDARGVLQDIHWSGGMLGYFSTYALGNLVSVQLWAKQKQANPGIDSQIAAGDFAPLLGWLRENIHQYGRKYEPQELVRRVTGSSIDPAPYLGYLKQKYSEVYAL